MITDIAGGLAELIIRRKKYGTCSDFCKRAKKSFKGKEVLKGVDLEVQRGEIFALLGSNGAGKTTTVNILSTLLKGDGGEVDICGHDVQRQPDHVRQSISLTGQFSALDGMLTGRENLMMIAKLRGFPILPLSPTICLQDSA